MKHGILILFLLLASCAARDLPFHQRVYHDYGQNIARINALYSESMIQVGKAERAGLITTEEADEAEEIGQKVAQALRSAKALAVATLETERSEERIVAALLEADAVLAEFLNFLVSVGVLQ